MVMRQMCLSKLAAVALIEDKDHAFCVLDSCSMSEIHNASLEMALFSF
jgi:hypothetical protein